MDFGPQAPMVAAPLSQLCKAKSSSRRRRPGGPQPGPQIWYPAGHPARGRPQPGCATARRYTVPCPPYLFPSTLREYGGPFFIRANLFERGHSNTCNLASVVFLFFFTSLANIFRGIDSPHSNEKNMYHACEHTNISTYMYMFTDIQVIPGHLLCIHINMYTYAVNFLIAALVFWRSSPN